ncbi:MAG: cytidine deaminase [Balneolaceae bacterium]
MIELKSYSPYSGIEESCFIEGASGLFYPGVRIENVSFSLTISAVRAAVCSCLANGDQPRQLYHLKSTEQPDLTDFWVNEFALKKKEKLPDKFEQYNPILFTDLTDKPIEELTRLCKNAVTIHSDFPVSSLLKTDLGYISGVNVEVSSWSMGLCAERVAISRAISHGLDHFEIIYVYAPKSSFCSPCGSCRQVMNEFMHDKVVELHHSDHTISRHFVQHLLPYGIVTDKLKKNR